MCFPCVCLSVPCALLLLSVSPPLTCSQSPGLCVSLVSPVSCEFPLFSPPMSCCLVPPLVFKFSLSCVSCWFVIFSMVSSVLFDCVLSCIPALPCFHVFWLCMCLGP